MENIKDEKFLINRLDLELRSASLWNGKDALYVEVRYDSEIEKAKRIITDCGYQIIRAYRSNGSDYEAYYIDIK
ncbi:MAG: hypothetical protein PHI22_01970 [Bacilli bacterium]|nr:hypothetical protein [Bacilli bacterium]